MRIAQITPYFHPHLGGVESHVRDLSRKLVELGHEVEVITSVFEPGLPSEETVDNFLVRRLPTRAIIAKTPIMAEIGQVLENGNFDVVHAHAPPPLANYLAGQYCHKHRIPFVYTYHCDMEIPIPGGKYIVSIYRHLLERWTIRWSDALICTTNSYAATSRTTWDRTVDVIPNAVDVQFFKPDTDGSKMRERHGLQEKTIVMFVGRIVHHKGIETFILSANHTEDSIHYLIVGQGEDTDRLKRMANEVDPTRFTFTGPVPRNELPEYYAAADMLILPSLSRLEAFGIVGLESMASGKPVILSRIPGVSEVITSEEEGMIFDPSNATDLGEKITELHSRPGLRREMGKRGRDRVLRDYSMRSVAQKVEAVFERVIREKEEL